MKDILVMKFGGTSMGSADRMRIAAQICADAQKRGPVAIVVSAMSKVTDLLLSTLRAAEEGDHDGVKENIRIIEKRHAETCREILPEDRRESVLASIHALIEEFDRISSGILMLAERFNGATVDGKPTTLGRGGSDFSASILASALDAEELWIWTDVDGIMSADPRLVPDAAVLDVVTYREAAELAYNGAKVLHPRTIAPLVEKRIPVWSKNSFNLAALGTKIVPHADSSGPRAVTSMSNVALISIEPASPAIQGTMLMGRVLEALGRANTEVLAFTSSSYRQTFCFLIRKDEVDAALESLKAELSLELAHEYVHPIEVDDNVGLLAVVGEGMAGHPGLAGRVFTAISAEHVNIIAIAQGSSELTISIVVRRDGLERAVKAVHAECKMGTPA